MEKDISSQFRFQDQARKVPNPRSAHFSERIGMLNGDISFKSWLYYSENTFQYETWREECGEMIGKKLL